MIRCDWNDHDDDGQQHAGKPAQNYAALQQRRQLEKVGGDVGHQPYSAGDQQPAGSGQKAADYRDRVETSPDRQDESSPCPERRDLLSAW